MSTVKTTKALLMNELKELSTEKWLDITLHNEDLLHWKVVLMVVNPDSLYHGGYFKATMKFPEDYPYSPPKFRFDRPLFHPNIYKDGRVCISILHKPGPDHMSGESSTERWSAAQGALSVLLSILSLLDDAEISSAANVDASVMFRDRLDKFKEVVKQNVLKSLEDAPKGFEMPTQESVTTMVKEEVDESFFYCESDTDSGDDDNEDNELAEFVDDSKNEPAEPVKENGAEQGEENGAEQGEENGAEQGEENGAEQGEENGAEQGGEKTPTRNAVEEDDGQDGEKTPTQAIMDDDDTEMTDVED